MAFVDEVKIYVKAGDGGKGCESFYQDKYTKPIADGGDGGPGGDVILLADKRIHTLLDFRFNQHYQGERGGHASSKNKTGKAGGDCVLRIPIGTLVRDSDTGLLIKDLVEDGQKVLVAKGGLGGRGNSKNRTPKPPTLGESRRLHLELKMIADVGLVGFPNVGKSTLINQISKVKSKIANYHFTTKQPILGIVMDDECQFVVADLPGLIEGAHEGKGLGDRFLKHTERTKILVHILDMAGSEGRDPLEDFDKINHELESYSDKLFFKQRIIVANKMDLPEAKENLKRFKKIHKGKIFAISALEKTGVEQLVDYLKDKICRANFRGRSNAL